MIVRKKFCDVNGLAKLLAMLQYKKLENPDELAEIIRRIHVPYYEEARLYWDTAKADGYFIDANEE